MIFNKFSKKNKNIITGILVGIASLYAIINYTKMPADEVQDFLLATLIFFVGIIVLAALAVLIFKLVAKMLARMFTGKEESPESETTVHNDDIEPKPDPTDRE